MFLKTDCKRKKVLYMKYDKERERDRLSETNEKLIQYIKDYPKESIYLTAIGNSISNGFSISEPGRLLLDRNRELIEVGKSQGIDVKTTQLSRSENNNALFVAEWIRTNCCEKDSHIWNVEDYRRHAREGNPLLTEEEMDEFFKNGKTEQIQDVIFDGNPTVANIVILNLGTGSFLDIVTRHGSLTLPTLFDSLNRDTRGISQILEFIQNNNRENGAHTQIFLCGAPRIVNTILTDLFMNPALMKMSEEYANVTYIPSFPRQAFYKTKSGLILPDPHYNQAEYYHLLNEIEQGIIQNYLLRDLIIDIDTILYRMSKENDINGANYKSSDALDVIKEIAKKYESKDGNYNDFLDLVSKYIKKRYPFDFYRLDTSANLGNKVHKLKK